MVISTSSWMRVDAIQADVTVIGFGLAGMAASIHLAKAGLQTLCIEPQLRPAQAVGESLDWSAPDLLQALGLPMDQLIRDGLATYKKHVVLKLEDGSDRHYVPGEWLGRPPFNIELRTMHVDRGRLDAALRQIAMDHGVKVVHDKVVGIERDGRRVATVMTAQGVRVCSPWFIDASGKGSVLFSGPFHLPVYEYGPKKVAMWSYFTVSELTEGTTLYAGGSKPPYMDWIWEIPIRADLISVGYVASGEAIKEQRQQGLSIEDIYRKQLARFPRFKHLLMSAGAITPSVTSFRCRSYHGISGPNWLLIGEAASLVDPMTSNGLTAALRHAAEASDLIVRSRRRKQLSQLRAAMYNRRVLDLGRFFNCGIEYVIYDAPIRNHIGVLTAGDAYTIPAWGFNHLYSRFRPTGIVSTFLFGFVLSLFRAAVFICSRLCKRLASSTQPLH